MKVVTFSIVEDRFMGMANDDVIELVKSMIEDGVYLDMDNIVSIDISVQDQAMAPSRRTFPRKIRASCVSAPRHPSIGIR